MRKSTSVHFVIFTIAAIATVAFSWANGLRWAGLATGALIGSRAAAAMLLTRQAAIIQSGKTFGSMFVRAHGFGWFAAGFLYVLSALAAETRWSAIAAVGCFAAAIVDFGFLQWLNAKR